jgi:hypothetical protein
LGDGISAAKIEEQNVRTINAVVVAVLVPGTEVKK